MAPQPAVFTRTYDETLALIVEARNYMAHIEMRARRQVNGLPGLRFSCEALRITARLTQALAWLLMQRAVYQGEIPMAVALCDANRLSGHDVCLDNSSSDDENLPAGLRSLLDRSYRLYQRVARLEEMALTRIAV